MWSCYLEVAIYVLSAVPINVSCRMQILREKKKRKSWETGSYYSLSRNHLITYKTNYNKYIIN